MINSIQKKIDKDIQDFLESYYDEKHTLEIDENNFKNFCNLNENLRNSLTPEETAEVIISGTSIFLFLNKFENETSIIESKNNLKLSRTKKKKKNKTEAIKLTKPLRRI